MDIKTNAVATATTAGNGRRKFRGGRWRPTGDASIAATSGAAPNVLATNVNYVVELKSEDVAATLAGAPVLVGCGVFRPYNEESFKKNIEDVFTQLTAANDITATAAAYPAAAAGNTAQVLTEMQANQAINRQ